MNAPVPSLTPSAARALTAGRPVGNRHRLQEEPEAHPDSGPPVVPPPVACLGDPGARLLAGPTTREDLAAHVRRVGPLPTWEPGDEGLNAMIQRAGLTGRGGGHFPISAKLETARQAGGTPVVVVNATESEPASAKDRHLLEYRPHLVIDGALIAATACGAPTVILATHEGSPASASLQQAVEERSRSNQPGRFDPGLELATVPARYLSGESSALVSYLGGGPALPTSRSRPTAECGLSGRPTVVSNAETVSHLALLARHGDRWFRESGTSTAPGSLLVTLAGDVASPGTVCEVVRPVALTEVVARYGGTGDRWQAVLLGGYGGTWVSRRRAGEVLLNGGRADGHTVPIGCGLIAVISDRRCGLAEAARVLDWLTAERAGQCGACSFGLPLVADQVAALADGRARLRRTQRRVASLAHSVAERGLCHLPDGAIAMAESALEAFTDEAALHRRGRCTAESPPDALPLPDTDGGRR